MRSTSLTLQLAISGFPDANSEDSKGLTQVKPNDVTRVAFNKDGYDKVQFSSGFGPQNDGMLELVDAIAIAADEIDISGYDRALIVRVQSTRGMDSNAAQKVGEALEAYMTRNGVSEFATAAIADIAQGQQLHGKWNTLLLVRTCDGAWTFKNLRFTSIQRSTGNTYAILRNGQLAKIDGGSLVSTLLDNQKLQALIDGGRQLEGNRKKHLVRAPLQTGAFAVIDENGQTIYDDSFKVVVTGKAPFVVMPAINEDGTYADGQVTTVSGQGDKWDIRNRIPAAKADALAKAYGATA